MTLTITSPFAIDSSFLANYTSLTIILPSNFTSTANTTCQPFLGSCAINNGTITVNGVGLSLSSFTVIINKVILPYFNPSSTSFSVSYLYNNSQVATVNTGVVVSVFCISPC